MKRQAGKKSTELIPGVENDVLVGLFGLALVGYVAIRRPGLLTRLLQLFTAPAPAPAPEPRPRLLH